MIAVVVVGLIAVFLVPKVLESVTDQQYQAKMKQTIDILDKVEALGLTTGDLTPSNFTNYFMSNLNASKKCTTNAYAQECILTNNGNYNGQMEIPQPGLILPNGVSIVGLDNCCTSAIKGMYFNGLLIDVNGLQGPNTIGQDQLEISYCYGPTNCVASNPQNPYAPNANATNPYPTGSIAPSDSPSYVSSNNLTLCKANIALFNKLMNANWVSTTPGCQ